MEFRSEGGAIGEGSAVAAANSIVNNRSSDDSPPTTSTTLNENAASAAPKTATSEKGKEDDQPHEQLYESDDNDVLSVNSDNSATDEATFSSSQFITITRDDNGTEGDDMAIADEGDESDSDDDDDDDEEEEEEYKEEKIDAYNADDDTLTRRVRQAVTSRSHPFDRIHMSQIKVWLERDLKTGTEGILKMELDKRAAAVMSMHRSNELKGQGDDADEAYLAPNDPILAEATDGIYYRTHSVEKGGGGSYGPNGYPIAYPVPRFRIEKREINDSQWYSATSIEAACALNRMMDKVVSSFYNAIYSEDTVPGKKEKFKVSDHYYIEGADGGNLIEAPEEEEEEVDWVAINGRVREALKPNSHPLDSIELNQISLSLTNKYTGPDGPCECILRLHMEGAVSRLIHKQIRIDKTQSKSAEPIYLTPTDARLLKKLEGIEIYRQKKEGLVFQVKTPQFISTHHHKITTIETACAIKRLHDRVLAAFYNRARDKTKGRKGSVSRRGNLPAMGGVKFRLGVAVSAQTKTDQASGDRGPQRRGDAKHRLLEAISHTKDPSDSPKRSLPRDDPKTMGTDSEGGDRGSDGEGDEEERMDRSSMSVDERLLAAIKPTHYLDKIDMSEVLLYLSYDYKETMDDDESSTNAILNMKLKGSAKRLLNRINRDKYPVEVTEALITPEDQALNSEITSIVYATNKRGGSAYTAPMYRIESPEMNHRHWYVAKSLETAMAIRRLHDKCITAFYARMYSKEGLPSKGSVFYAQGCEPAESTVELITKHDHEEKPHLLVTTSRSGRTVAKLQGASSRQGMSTVPEYLKKHEEGEKSEEEWYADRKMDRMRFKVPSKEVLWPDPVFTKASISHKEERRSTAGSHNNRHDKDILTSLFNHRGGNGGNGTYKCMQCDYSVTEASRRRGRQRKGGQRIYRRAHILGISSRDTTACTYEYSDRVKVALMAEEELREANGGREDIVGLKELSHASDYVGLMKVAIKEEKASKRRSKSKNNRTSNGTSNNTSSGRKESTHNIQGDADILKKRKANDLGRDGGSGNGNGNVGDDLTPPGDMLDPGSSSEPIVGEDDPSCDEQEEDKKEEKNEKHRSARNRAPVDFYGPPPWSHLKGEEEWQTHYFTTASTTKITGRDKSSSNGHGRTSIGHNSTITPSDNHGKNQKLNPKSSRKFFFGKQRIDVENDTNTDGADRRRTRNVRKPGHFDEDDSDSDGSIDEGVLDSQLFTVNEYTAKRGKHSAVKEYNVCVFCSHEFTGPRRYRRLHILGKYNGLVKPCEGQYPEKLIKHLRREETNYQNIYVYGPQANKAVAVPVKSEMDNNFPSTSCKSGQRRGQGDSSDSNEDDRMAVPLSRVATALKRAAQSLSEEKGVRMDKLNLSLFEDITAKDDYCRECGMDDGRLLIECDYCPAAYHKNCNNDLKKVPEQEMDNYDFKCTNCKGYDTLKSTPRHKSSNKTARLQSSSLSEDFLHLSDSDEFMDAGIVKNDNDYGNFKKDDFCKVCGKEEGLLIECDHCTSSYHKKCSSLLRKIREQDLDDYDFKCSQCRKTEKERKKATKRYKNDSEVSDIESVGNEMEFGSDEEMEKEEEPFDSVKEAALVRLFVREKRGRDKNGAPRVENICNVCGYSTRGGIRSAREHILGPLSIAKNGVRACDGLYSRDTIAMLRRGDYLYHQEKGTTDLSKVERPGRVTKKWTYTHPGATPPSSADEEDDDDADDSDSDGNEIGSNCDDNDDEHGNNTSYGDDEEHQMYASGDDLCDEDDVVEAIIMTERVKTHVAKNSSIWHNECRYCHYSFYGPRAKSVSHLLRIKHRGVKACTYRFHQNTIDVLQEEEEQWNTKEGRLKMQQMAMQKMAERREQEKVQAAIARAEKAAREAQLSDDETSFYDTESDEGDGGSAKKKEGPRGPPAEEENEMEIATVYGAISTNSATHNAAAAAALLFGVGNKPATIEGAEGEITGSAEVEAGGQSELSAPITAIVGMEDLYGVDEETSNGQIDLEQVHGDVQQEPSEEQELSGVMEMIEAAEVGDVGEKEKVTPSKRKIDAEGIDVDVMEETEETTVMGSGVEAEMAPDKRRRGRRS